MGSLQPLGRTGRSSGLVPPQEPPSIRCSLRRFCQPSWPCFGCCPNLPPFRAAIDKRYKQRALLAERAFYLDHLWELTPREQSLGERVLSAFVQRETDDYDDRVIHRIGVPEISKCRHRRQASRNEHLAGISNPRS